MTLVLGGEQGERPHRGEARARVIYKDLSELDSSGRSIRVQVQTLDGRGSGV